MAEAPREHGPAPAVSRADLGRDGGLLSCAQEVAQGDGPLSHPCSNEVIKAIPAYMR